MFKLKRRGVVRPPPIPPPPSSKKKSPPSGACFIFFWKIAEFMVYALSPDTTGVQKFPWMRPPSRKIPPTPSEKIQALGNS